MYIPGLDLSNLVVAEPGASYQSGSSQSRWIEVLVDCPGAKEIYTYRLPDELEVQPGDILSVPFGASQVGAIAIRVVNQPPNDLPPDKIRDIEDVVSVGFFPATYWDLLNRVAEYYYTPLMQVARVALPPGLLGRSSRRIRLVEGAGSREQGAGSREQGAGSREQGAGSRVVGAGFTDQFGSKQKNEPVGKWEQENPQTKIPSGREVFLSPAARQILELLLAQPSGDYSFIYLQRQVRGASRAVRELLRASLVESYLEPPRHNRPKLQKAVTLVGTGFERDVSDRQREILEVLRRRGSDMWVSELLQVCNASSATLKALEKKGYIAILEREVLRMESGPVVVQDRPKSLTTAQQQALATITQLDRCAQVLLHGVTGSGKTEVYLQAIAPLLQQGKSALVLVPEIGLTPQLTDRFRARFGNKVCVYHSALSDGERYDTWRQMLTSEPQVVIGTRSAVFAPLPKLGLIILDEEHDGSFKQDSPIPTYHARTVAQWRSQLENCPLVLGSATPALETWVSVRREGAGTKEQGRAGEEFPPLTPSPPLPLSYYLSLPERIQSRPLPPVEVVDMRQEFQEGNRSIFSRSLQDALQQLQEKEQQGILFIHRRGHSTFVSCRSCGYVIECPNCDVSLAYHHTQEGAPELLQCHYCNFVRSQDRSCPECSSPYLKFFGSGTQRVAQELARQYPELRFIRFDSDTTRTKGAHRTLMTQFINREADLLVGTQMLTKGLDLPQVTLVGVVAADGLLHLPDYRASERAFQTLLQVAGRAGRGDEPGRVIVQTYSPEHQVIQAVQGHEYESFTEVELQQRAVLNYPPYGRLILLRLSSTDAAVVENTAQRVADVLSPKDGAMSGYELLGPAPASIMRVANRYRWQILLKIAARAMPELPDWDYVRSLLPSSDQSSVSLTIDVDPLNFM